MFGYLPNPSGMNPRTRRTASASSTALYPQTNASPSVGVSSVERIRIVVVFPAPFGPMKPITCPGRAANETSSTAFSLPNRFDSPRTSNDGGAS